MAVLLTAASVRVWFRLEGAASTDFLDVSSNNNVAQLRKAIYAELKAELEPRGITARLLVLSTAGKTYDDEEATVPTVHQTKKDALIVTGTFVRAARSPFAAAYGPRSSCGGRTSRRSRYADPLCSCALRVYVALCCAVGSRCPARVDSFVEFCSSVEFCVSQVVTVAPSLRNWMWFSRALVSAAHAICTCMTRCPVSEKLCLDVDERKTVVLSKCNAARVNSMCQHLRVTWSAAELADVKEVLGDTSAPFSWNCSAEASQKAEYREWFNRALPLSDRFSWVKLKTEVIVEHAQGVPVLPFKIRGKSDALIVLSASNASGCLLALRSVLS